MKISGLIVVFSLSLSLFIVGSSGHGGPKNLTDDDFTKCSATKPCPGEVCCSEYGYCGCAESYCGEGCQSNCVYACGGEEPCSVTNPCPDGMCCNKWGNCHWICGSDCASQCGEQSGHGVLDMGV
ncbi:lectin-B-like [Mercurialis annua]|uniref:lectin-B-like n=1 Tax=Mercurialis annua TaxID=3986 RepID=UPI00215E7859|nr:lectin-B-like [Mercurialis annua]